jgi:hypothetical protein
MKLPNIEDPSPNPDDGGAIPGTPYAIILHGLKRKKGDILVF